MVDEHDIARWHDDGGAPAAEHLMDGDEMLAEEMRPILCPHCSGQLMDREIPDDDETEELWCQMCGYAEPV